MAAAGLIGIGSSLLGGIFGSKAADAAEAALFQGQNNASALNYLNYGRQRLDQYPYTSAGAGAMNYLSYLLGIGGGPNGQIPASMQGPDPYKQLYGGKITFTGDDGSNINIKQSGNSFLMGNDHLRGYQFLYNDGVNDIYKQVSGGPHPVYDMSYAVVGKDGKITMTGTPPVMGQNAHPAGQSTIPDGATNDPNFGSLMKDFSQSDFQADPGYEFRINEGAKALQRSAAAKGGLYSGGTLKDLTNYNQNFASNEYQNSYNRSQNNRATKFNQLAAIAGIGQVATNQLGNTGNQMTGQMSNIYTNTAGDIANARASSYANWAQALTGAANAGLNWYQLSRGNGGTSNSGNGSFDMGQGIYG